MANFLIGKQVAGSSLLIQPEFPVSSQWPLCDSTGVSGVFPMALVTVDHHSHSAGKSSISGDEIRHRQLVGGIPTPLKNDGVRQWEG